MSESYPGRRAGPRVAGRPVKPVDRQLGRLVERADDPVPVGDLSWEQYLDELEQAALALETEVHHGRLPAWLDVKPPQAPVPERLRIRAEMLLMLLTDVTERTELQRDVVCAELQSMPHTRPLNHSHLASLGRRLDVLT